MEKSQHFLNENKKKKKQEMFLCAHIQCNTIGSQPDGSKWVRILEIILDEVE